MTRSNQSSRCWRLVSAVVSGLVQLALPGGAGTVGGVGWRHAQAGRHPGRRARHV